MAAHNELRKLRKEMKLTTEALDRANKNVANYHMRAMNAEEENKKINARIAEILEKQVEENRWLRALVGSTFARETTYTSKDGMIEKSFSTPIEETTYKHWPTKYAGQFR